MTAPETQGPTVTQADREWADEIELEFWSGTGEIAEIIARHREAAEAASRAREAELREALAEMVALIDSNILGLDPRAFNVTDGTKRYVRVLFAARAALAHRSQSEKGEG